MAHFNPGYTINPRDPLSFKAYENIVAARTLNPVGIDQAADQATGELPIYVAQSDTSINADNFGKNIQPVAVFDTAEELRTGGVLAGRVGRPALADTMLRQYADLRDAEIHRLHADSNKARILTGELAQQFLQALFELPDTVVSAGETSELLVPVRTLERAAASSQPVIPREKYLAASAQVPWDVRFVNDIPEARQHKPTRLSRVGRGFMSLTRPRMA